MKRKLVFVTNNQHKVEEVSQIVGTQFEIVTLKDLQFDRDIEETAKTLEGNALIKARYIYDRFHVDCFADDSGLEVIALNNAPGVYSARYGGEDKNADKNMNRLLLELRDKDNRQARFRTVIALILNGEEYIFEGAVEGEIIKDKRGSEGFGYDPIFIPKGYTQTFSELSGEVKNKISHRARAIQAFIEFLKTKI